MSAFIESLQTSRESKTLDFKERVDFDSDDGKIKFLDDVVAFANQVGGSIVVGVRQDKKGGFHSFAPVQVEDEDKLRLKILQIIETGVKPIVRAEIDFYQVDGGAVIDIRIPEGRLKPYQNAKNASFYIRGDARNSVMFLEEIKSLSLKLDDFQASARRLMADQDARISEGKILANESCTIHLVLVPREAFQSDRAWFDPGRGSLKTIPTYNHRYGGRWEIFHGCEGGFEMRDIHDFNTSCYSRLFLADNWSIHAAATDPIYVGNEGRATIQEFRKLFKEYIEAIFAFYEEEKIHGPFFFLTRLDNLDRNSKVKFFFPTANRVESRPILGEKEEIIASLDVFYDRILDSSRYRR